MKSSSILGHVLPFVPLTAAHSWVERASRIAPNGTMIGPHGFARGYVPRDDPAFTDVTPTHILPPAGQPVYSGDEILNKFPPNANPGFPLLEAAPGDHIAIIHLENGHTTLPQNQPNKPRNRGTIFFYGTAQPKDEERLFDIHLVWNRDGTGGDKRGRLLGTRNYDDGQCYQPSASELSTSRASTLAPEGAKHEIELACQSDIKLPSDLEDGSTYTIYWYWDWPDLNPEEIDIEKTKNGRYPWGGSFVRSKKTKDANGFTEKAILKNESYSSVLDVKITKTIAAKGEEGFKSKAGNAFIQEQDIYTKAIKEQMDSNFQVDVDVPGDAPGNVDSPEPEVPQPSESASAPAGGATLTVTATVTVPPSTVVETVTVTAGQPTDTPGGIPGGVFVTSILPGVSRSSAAPEQPSPSSSSSSAAASSTLSTSTVYPPKPEETQPSATEEAGGSRPTVTPFLLARRNWSFGYW